MLLRKEFIDVNAIVDSSKAGAIKYGTMNIGIKNLRGNFTFDKKDDFSTKLSYSGSSEPFIASRADSSSGYELNSAETLFTLVWLLRLTVS